jgi:hypothetical protein
VTVGCRRETVEVDHERGWGAVEPIGNDEHVSAGPAVGFEFDNL